MLRSDILQVKTSQASAEHRREVVSLGRVRDREDRARDHVQQREQRFWREITRAASEKGAPHGEHSFASHRGALDRALEAHRLLRAAKEQHAGASKELRLQLSKVMRATISLEMFTKLQRKDRMHREHRRVERSGEQIEETMVSRLARRSPTVRSATTRDAMDLREASVSEACRREARHKLETVAPSMVPHPDPTAKGAEPSRCGITVAETLSLQSVKVDTNGPLPALIVNVEHRGAPMACRLRETPSGEVGVVLGISSAPLSDRIHRHGSVIVNKLSEIGIKVSSIEVRRESDGATSFNGACKRGRRTREEQDENTLS